MRSRSLSVVARPSLFALALAIAACGSSTNTESDADDITSGVGEAAFVRPIVERAHALVIANPNSDEVTRPVWGGAVSLDRTVAFHAVLDAKRGASGLVFGGRGDPEQADTDRSVAV